MMFTLSSEDYSGVAIEPRRIRSSGKTTGSVEITLPPEFQIFAGMECRLIGQGGLTPSLTIIPGVDGIEKHMRQIWSVIAIGFGIADHAYPAAKIRYTFDTTKYEDGILEVGLRDCGWLMNAPLSTQPTVQSARLLVNLCHCFIAEAKPVTTLGYHLFLANSVVYVVCGDNPALGLFERDTVSVALHDGEIAPGNNDESIISAARWAHSRPAISRLLDHVKRMSHANSTLDDQRKDWSRAQRIASKVA
jgi:hypothetical protein